MKYAKHCVHLTLHAKRVKLTVSTAGHKLAPQWQFYIKIRHNNPTVGGPRPAQAIYPTTREIMDAAHDLYREGLGAGGAARASAECERLTRLFLQFHPFHPTSGIGEDYHILALCQGNPTYLTLAILPAT